MKYVLSILGVTAAIVLLAVSAAMNWRFGFTLGKTEFDGHIYGAASAAADGLKALSPFFILWAFRQRNYIQSLAGIAILVVCSFYSLTSSLGFAAFNRAETTGERAVHANRYSDLRKELKHAEEKLSWVPQHRPQAVVQTDLNAILQKPVYSRKHGLLGSVEKVSDGCTKAVWGTRNSCSKVHELKKELVFAKQSGELETRIRNLKSKIAKVSAQGGAATVAGADPQSAFLSKILGINISDIQTGLTLLVSLLVEVGSGLGLFVAVSNVRATRPDAHFSSRRTYDEEPEIEVRRRPIPLNRPVKKLMLPKSDLERYHADCVEKSEDTSVTATALYENYCKWCEVNGREPMALPVFGRQFSELGIQKAKVGGRIRYIGIELKEIEIPEEEDPEVATAV